MATTQSKSPFTPEQLDLMHQGAMHAANLREWVLSALQVEKKKIVVKPHWYILSSPGLGKTHTVQRTCAEAGIKPVMIQGDTSMAAFVRKVAITMYQQAKSKKKSRVFVVVDDCDDLFNTKEALNVMKGILDLEREVLSWERDMSGQIAKYRKSDSAITNEIADAMEHFQTEDGVGLTIPMQDVSFIFLTNKALSSAMDAKRYKPNHIAHQEAPVRNRLEYKRIPDEGKLLWGYNANLVLNQDILGSDFSIPMDKRFEMLNWMYTNWRRLPSASIRDAMDLAAAVINHPNNYTAHWDQKLEAS